MNRFGICVAAGVLALTSAFAQGTGGDGGGTGNDQTCSAPATGITSLSIERSLSLTSINTTQNFSGNINQDVLTQIAGGGLQVREQFNFEPNSKTLRSNVFAMTPSANSPTDLTSIPTNQVLGGYTVAVDNVYFSCTPVPNVLMVGRITATNSTNLFGGNLNGAPVAVSFGYTTANPPQINNVVLVIAGTVAGYSAAGAGTLNLVTSPVVNPPGSTGGGPVIVVVGGPDQITSQRQMTLNAAGTTDPAGTQVSYAWTQPMPGSNVPGCEDPNRQCTLQAVISDANTATPTVSFSSGRGDYLFVLTATNAGGAATTQVIRIRYVGII